MSNSRLCLSQDGLMDKFEREKRLLEEALETKKLKGSIILEKVSCGKTRCRKCRGILRVHGPYNYLHFYTNGTVRKKYLGKDLTVLLSQDSKDLEKRLAEVKAEIKRLMTSGGELKK